MELSELKTKCGFIWARRAFNSTFDISTCLSNSSFSLLRMLRMRSWKVTKIVRRAKATTNTMNHQVLKKGVFISNENSTGTSFHTPSLLQLFNLNVYLPGG